MKKIWETLREFVQEEEAVGVVEIILILVVRFTVYYEICIGCIT